MSFSFLLVPLLLAGCAKKQSSEPVEQPAESTQAAVTTPTTSTTSTKSPTVPDQPPSEDVLHQTFAQATRRDAPEGSRPPDQTLTGKATAKLFEEVLKTWDTVKFMTPEKKMIAYTAVIETRMGNIEIELKPEWAPNHVRNFIALAKVGYYDGLMFDRIIQDESDVEQGTQFMEIEAGCAKGTGEAGAESIGYWLLPETHPDAKHLVGALGACRGQDKDTAACKFYVTLCDADYLNGEFTVYGKITKGLDIARKIFMQPTLVNEDDPQGSRRPVNPIVMEKVTIVSKVVNP